MSKIIQVFVNDGSAGRKLVDAELISENQGTVVVRLVDGGKTIKRSKRRDLLPNWRS